jgi:hypothetical protein
MIGRRSKVRWKFQSGKMFVLEKQQCSDCDGGRFDGPKPASTKTGYLGGPFLIWKVARSI